MIKKFEDYNSDVNPFDMDSKYQYVEFTNPLYCILSKNKSAIIKYMTPRKYLETIAKGFNLSYQDTIDSNAVSDDLVDRYANDMLRGDKFPLPFIRRDTSLQEGRHRTLAAMKIGVKEIPVIEFFYLTYDEVKNIAYGLKNKSENEVERFLIDRGFDRFTALDKRELVNVFKYKF